MRPQYIRPFCFLCALMRIYFSAVEGPVST